MNRLAKLTFTESKLFLRDPMAVFFAVAFPPLLLAILGAIPAFREPSEDLGGLRVVDLYVPVIVAFVLACSPSAWSPPTWPPTGEKGVLRRLLREALDLWRGPALADLGEVTFAQAQAVRLEELRTAAVEDRVEAELALGSDPGRWRSWSSWWPPTRCGSGCAGS